MSQTGIDLTQVTSPNAQGQRSLLAGKKLKHLRALEAESIFILRGAVAEFANSVMLYSIGKDSSVLLRLAQKAFFPGKIHFPLLHIDTSYKFPEMIEFRDRYAKELGAELIVHRNRVVLDAGASPSMLGTQKCCGLLNTWALLDVLAARGFTAAFGGARRDEKKSRSKERVYSFRDIHGQWDPKNQRPELWNLFNSRIDKGESIRVFPLSHDELRPAGRRTLFSTLWNLGLLILSWRERQLRPKDHGLFKTGARILLRSFGRQFVQGRGARFPSRARHRRNTSNQAQRKRTEGGLK